MRYQLYAVRVFTTDWNRSVAFYRDTIGLPLRLLNEDFAWAEFDVGSGCLAIERIDAGSTEAGDLVGRFVGVSLKVADLAAAHAKLEARGVNFLGPPVKQEWGGSLAHFEDLDGNVLTLCEIPDGT